MKYFFISILISLLAINLPAQEILTGLPVNPAVKQAALLDQKSLEQNNLKSSKLEIPHAVNLPFFDDFKQKGIFPDTARWLNNDVYINSDFSLFPPSWGVATFDAIDSKGNIYGDANPLQFIADQLISRPIRLDSIFSPSAKALSPIDSIYLSFYFQPEGTGNDPQPQDSLVLDFGFYTGNFTYSHVDSITVLVEIYGVDTIFPGDTLFSPCDFTWGTRILDTLFLGDYVTLPCDSVLIPETSWHRVWGVPGSTLNEFLAANDSQYFKQVFIPIVDSMWFRNDFQFRLMNYASIASDNLQSWQSNCDYWNVDYIVLDRNRSRLDTTHRDVTFSQRAPSFLKEFQSMPFYQYSDDPVEALNGMFDMYISNLDNGNQTVQYTYEVYNDLGQLEFGYDAGNGDLRPFNVSGFSDYVNFAFPPVNGVFPPFGNRDSIYFDIRHHLKGDPVLGLGDTMSFRQKFYNYYAYDDGTAEFGYGLTPAGSQLAYQFTLNRRDTLRAVDFYFNKTLKAANQQYFTLAVWNDLEGQPGDIIYSKERHKPQFSDSLYQFYRIPIDELLPVQGTIYVGWIQDTPNNLNVGFDANNDVSKHIFYNTTGTWTTSSYQGALMIRPVLGKLPLNHPDTKSTTIELFRIAPNPSYDGQIKIKFLNYPNYTNEPGFVLPKQDELSQIKVLVYNLMGQRVYEGNYQPTIDLSHLHNGIYIIRLIDPVKGRDMSEKLQILK
jgi:hypothetical protein